LQKFAHKKEWVLTTEAFEQLLNWLDKGKSSGGEYYLEIRRRLVDYFSRKDCLRPDDLADETFNRIARRLTEESIAKDPVNYCYIVARFVFLEHLRAKERNDVPLDAVTGQIAHERFTASGSDLEAETKEKTFACLDKCVAQLDSPSREMILRYYTGKERIKIENRRELSASLGITMNALSIRVCRIRDKLEACVRKCLMDG